MNKTVDIFELRADNAKLKEEVESVTNYGNKVAQSHIDAMEEVLGLKTEVERLKKTEEYLRSVDLQSVLKIDNLQSEVERLEKGWDKETEALHRWIVAEKDLQSQLDKANEENNKLINKGLELKIENITANKRVAELRKYVEHQKYMFDIECGCESCEALRALEVGEQPVKCETCIKAMELEASIGRHVSIDRKREKGCTCQALEVKE